MARGGAGSLQPNTSIACEDVYRTAYASGTYSMAARSCALGPRKILREWARPVLEFTMTLSFRGCQAMFHARALSLQNVHTHAAGHARARRHQHRRRDV